MTNKLKITLAIPSNRGLKNKMAESALRMVAYSSERCDFHIICPSEGYTTAESRNYSVSQALKNKSDYLLFADDDMTFPNDTLQKLLDTGKRIVGVLSYSRMLPLKPTVVPVDKIINELFECKEVGGGVLLIDTKVFKEIPQPWFAYETYPFGMVKVGEDAFFCHKARENGIGVWCEPRIKISHIGDYLYG